MEANPTPKRLEFRGTARDDLRAFPPDARLDAGQELYRVQLGREPKDFKSMPSIGAGVNEIRIATEGEAFRVLYVAKFADAIYVLHCFEKKTQKTSRKDIALAERRYRQLKEDLKR